MSVRISILDRPISSCLFTFTKRTMALPCLMVQEQINYQFNHKKTSNTNNPKTRQEEGGGVASLNDILSGLPLVAYFVAFINLPNESPLGETEPWHTAFIGNHKLRRTNRP